VLGEFGFPFAALAAAEAGGGRYACGARKFRAGGDPAAGDFAVPESAHRRYGGEVGLVVGAVVTFQLVV
jgi:hypothetical protein